MRGLVPRVHVLR